ncbi:hypothetical protein Pth03_52600 [Planotetraspora thailandica]|uniref:Uncharacterized protein n=1 Tax=Planotetraspora thailandica TaxID=487172 RepID=A0A8J3XY71_9ACTN|nr:hypothetical protein [Planotetraspora thailandica]GII56871.1 hypothetical protein Pth03_52600 [Planotetraspora thailandica]
MSHRSDLIHAGWIWEENARVLCEILASLVGYTFDDLDWQAVGSALPDTDDDGEGRWYSYFLVGAEAALELRLARAVGGSELSFEVFGSADGVLYAQIKLAGDMATRYAISNR